MKVEGRVEGKVEGRVEGTPNDMRHKRLVTNAPATTGSAFRASRNLGHGIFRVGRHLGTILGIYRHAPLVERLSTLSTIYRGLQLVLCCFWIAAIPI